VIEKMARSERTWLKVNGQMLLGNEYLIQVADGEMQPLLVSYI
jgi:hypothetical protein